MSRNGTRIATAAALGGGLLTALLALSPTASAEPAAPLIPGVPGLDVMQQLAAAPQMLQQAASILGGVPQAPANAVAPTAPLATASVAVPQTAPALPGLPATGTPATLPNTLPNTGATVPATPGLPSALLNQLQLPPELTALARGGLPIPSLGASPAAVPGTAALPTAGLPAGMNPLTALP